MNGLTPQLVIVYILNSIHRPYRPHVLCEDIYASNDGLWRLLFEGPRRFSPASQSTSRPRSNMPFTITILPFIISILPLILTSRSQSVVTVSANGLPYLQQDSNSDVRAARCKVEVGNEGLFFTPLTVIAGRGDIVSFVFVGR